MAVHTFCPLTFDTGGRFLLHDESLKNQTFRLTPLQSYFADIYASLQTELMETKGVNRQRTLRLDQERARCQQLEREMAEERSARREAEERLNSLQAELIAIKDNAKAWQARCEKVTTSLDVTNDELNRLKQTFSQAQALFAESFVSHGSVQNHHPR
jgi:chromosome segregation ATPase